MSEDLILLPKGHFRKIALEKFQPEKCIRILADEREAYGGLKKILYIGLCTWMIAPQNAALIKSSLILATLKTLSEAEKADKDEVRPNTAASDMQARYIILGAHFIEEIYYALGGALGLARAPSIKDFKAAVGNESPRMDYAITVAEIYHHHVLHLSTQKRYGKPSLNKAADLLIDLKILHGNFKAPPKSRYVRDAWYQNRESISLLYSASTIVTSSGKTLLEKVKMVENNFEDDEIYLQEWFSRARFIVDTVLSQSVETDTHEDNEWVLPDSVKKRHLRAPRFDEAQCEVIRQKFSRSAI